MKKIIYTIIVLIIVHCTLFIDNCMSQWIQMSNGMGNGKILRCSVLSGNNIFAGMDSSGVYISTNYGNSWSQTALNNKYVHSLAVSVNNLFAGTDSSGVYLSTNNGTSWTQTSLNNKYVRCLAVNGNYIFAGTYVFFNPQGVYVSTNNGTSWTQTSMNNLYVRCLAVSGTNIYAGTYNDPAGSGGVWLSSNNGSSWIQTSLNNLSVHSIVISGNNIFAGLGSHLGVYLSTNNGTTWTLTTLNNQSTYSLAVSGNNVFAGTEPGGIFLSTNNGTNWIQKNQGFGAGLTSNTLLITSSYIFAGLHGQSVWRRDLAEIIGIQNISTEIPSSFSLSQNYPNPFNPSTNVQFSIPNVQFVSLKVFDILGKEITTLVNEKLQPGTYETSFDASQLPSGIYFYRLNAGNFSETKKMLMIK